MQACAMTHLTVVIDDDLLRAARIKAWQQGTSVNEICREAVTRFAAPGDLGDFMAQLIARADRMRQTRGLEACGPAAKRWTKKARLNACARCGPRRTATSRRGDRC